MTKLNVVLLFALIASGLYLVRVAYDGRRFYAELDRAQNEERQLDIEHERLKAERQAQATPLRVERTARDKLSMRPANPAITHYVTYDRPASAAPAAEGPRQ